VGVGGSGARRIGHNYSFGRARQTEHFNKRFP